MTMDSVSFRITRNTQDLAQAIHAISHRLVRLEQRLAALELALEAQARVPEVSEEELTSLDQVERLVQDCRTLLDAEVPLQRDGQHQDVTFINQEAEAA